MQVEVLWVVNQQQNAWEQALPQNTAAALAQSRGQQGKQGGIQGVIQELASGLEDVLSQGKVVAQLAL